VQVTNSAFTHGIAEAGILHAYTNAVRLEKIEQYGEDGLTVIGPDRAGNWLELVAMPAEQTDLKNRQRDATESSRTTASPEGSQLLTCMLWVRPKGFEPLTS